MAFAMAFARGDPSNGARGATPHSVRPLAYAPAYAPADVLMSLPSPTRPTCSTTVSRHAARRPTGAWHGVGDGKGVGRMGHAGPGFIVRSVRYPSLASGQRDG